MVWQPTSAGLCRVFGALWACFGTLGFAALFIQQLGSERAAAVVVMIAAARLPLGFLLVVGGLLSSRHAAQAAAETMHASKLLQCTVFVPQMWVMCRVSHTVASSLSQQKGMPRAGDDCKVLHCKCTIVQWSHACQCIAGAILPDASTY